ncbi:MAG: SDR family NAD(P)-dependent oxidoreductase [Gammaproteobacteria bacterium]|nr:SDR family NAD(P)-dependent oxidoreductase [Gammaproteobacteria bacterium]
MNEPSTSSIAGKVAFITGASRGIGRACAAVLAKRGAAVVLAARDRAACERAAAVIAGNGGRALAVRCDVADRASVDAAVNAVEARLGPVDILINNAGVVEPIAALASVAPAQFERTFSINVTGPLNLMQALLPQMKKRGGGTVINVSSGAAQRPLEGWTAYCVSKAALRMLGMSLALEHGADGIRVFNFRPGTVDTAMQGVIRASGVNPISKLTPGQHRQPEVPAKVIAYLCTAAADELVGEVSIDDAGLLARAGIE